MLNFKIILEHVKYLVRFQKDFLDATTRLASIHRCTWFENPGGGSMRFLPKIWGEGMWELWNFWMVGTLLFQYLNTHVTDPSAFHFFNKILAL